MLKSRYYAWLIPYVEGTLDANRRILLEKRIAADPKLAAEAEALRRVTSHLRRSAFAEAPVVAPRPVWPLIQERLRKHGPAPMISPRLAWGGAAVIAVGLAFAAKQPLQTPDEYFSGLRTASAPQHQPPFPFAAPPSIGASPFNSLAQSNSLAQPWNAPPAVPTNTHGSASEAREEARSVKTRSTSVAEQLPPLPVQFTGRVVGPVNPGAAPEHSSNIASAATASAAHVSLAQALRPSWPIRVSVPRYAMETVVADASERPQETADAPAMTSAGDGADMSAASANPDADSQAPPPSPRMAAATPLSGDLFHPAPTSSRDAIGIAGVNRLFLSIPTGSRATSRSLMSLRDPSPTQMLTSGQSVETLLAEAHGAQARGQFSSALDTWRDAVFVSLTPPTYADEEAASQTMRTLTMVSAAGRLGDLRARLESQRESAPDDIVSLRALGFLYLQMGDAKQANSVWSRVVASDLGVGEDWYQLAASEALNGNSAAAHDAYVNAVRPGALPVTSAHRAAAQRWLADPSR